MSWTDCDRWLHRAGLRFPTEAEWEYAARAGTPWPWWTGPDPASVQKVANLRDAHFRDARLEGWGTAHKDHPDGSAVHWPVNHAAQANRFGLYDVHGNVMEWCQDNYEAHEPVEEILVDPVAAGTLDLRRLCRGGGFRQVAVATRSFVRVFDPPPFSGSARGLRPARSLRSREE